MNLRVNVDAQPAIRGLQAVLRQVPYATSRAINGVLYESQAQLRQGLAQHFTVRRQTFLEQSIKVKPSTKHDLTGEIGVPPRPRSGIHEALAVQERGGTRPNPGGGQVAIPQEGIRPNSHTVTPPSKWPGRLKRVFKIRTAGGADLLLQRVGGKRGRGKRAVHGPVQAGHDPQLKVVYRLEDRVDIPKRWNFAATVLRVYRANFADRFAREFAKAIRTAR